MTNETPKILKFHIYMDSNINSYTVYIGEWEGKNFREACDNAFKNGNKYLQLISSKQFSQITIDESKYDKAKLTYDNRKLYNNRKDASICEIYHQCYACGWVGKPDTEVIHYEHHYFGEWGHNCYLPHNCDLKFGKKGQLRELNNIIEIYNRVSETDYMKNYSVWFKFDFENKKYVLDDNQADLWLRNSNRNYSFKSSTQEQIEFAKQIDTELLILGKEELV